jgi:hypothetical protein
MSNVGITASHFPESGTGSAPATGAELSGSGLVMVTVTVPPGSYPSPCSVIASAGLPEEGLIVAVGVGQDCASTGFRSGRRVASSMSNTIIPAIVHCPLLAMKHTMLSLLWKRWAQEGFLREFCNPCPTAKPTPLGIAREKPVPGLEKNQYLGLGTDLGSGLVGVVSFGQLATASKRGGTERWVLTVRAAVRSEMGRTCPHSAHCVVGLFWILRSHPWLSW